MTTTSSRPPVPTIFIGNIPYDLTEDELTKIFEEVGPVKSFRLVSDRETGMAKGYGFCEYHDTATAESAVRNLNNHEINGRSIRVDFADEHVSKPATPKTSDRDRHREENLPAKEMPIGIEAVRRAACKMAFLLGGRDVVLGNSPPMNGTNQEVYTILAEMRRKEMYEVLAGMKDVAQRNFAHAKALLLQNPQLSRTLFLMEIILGIVDAPELSDVTTDYDRVDMAGHGNYGSLVVNPPPPIQTLAGYESNAANQLPMTNYQSSTMFAPNNLSGMSIQNPGQNLSMIQGGMAFVGQDASQLMQQQYVQGMQVLNQQGMVPGMMSGQNHVLLNQHVMGQPQSIVPLGLPPYGFPSSPNHCLGLGVQQNTGESEMEVPQQMSVSTGVEQETLIPKDALDEQTKNQLNQILSLTEEQLAALPLEHREQALAIRRQMGKMN